jgi:hypothetical protein
MNECSFQSRLPFISYLKGLAFPDSLLLVPPTSLSDPLVAGNQNKIDPPRF